MRLLREAFKHSITVNAADCRQKLSEKESLSLSLSSSQSFSAEYSDLSNSYHGLVQHDLLRTTGHP